MQFGKMFFASLLAILVSGILLVVMLLFLVGIAASGSKGPVIASESVLYLKMDIPLTEHYDGDPGDLGDFQLPFVGGVNKMGLYEFTEKIRQAKNDDRIKGIYLETVGSAPAGWASLQTVRKSLEDFRASGKFIYAWAPYYTEATYYLASVADSVYMPSEGVLEMNGLGSSPFFVLGLFEKLGIQPRIFKVGEFKSAGEMFTRKDLSPENREQTETYLKGLWNEFASAVAISRKKSPADLDRIANSLFEGSGPDALREGLVDRLCDETEVGFALRRALGQDDKGKLRYVKYADWFSVPAPAKGKTDGRIAVVFAEGDIVGGKGTSDQIGMERMTGLLRKMRKDDNIKAVVLRINSPGGDALASDLIASEVKRLNAVKPVMVSMGDVAASGGYYIAAPATRVFAQANTLTGSIGVIGLQFGTADFLTGKLGVSFDQVATHPYANVGDPNRPISDAERAFIQKGVERVYGRFLQVVRDGRGFKDTLEVDRVARGRVWTGTDAHKLKLVDEIGGLQEAIAAAAGKAGLSDFQVVTYPEQLGPFQELLKSFGGVTTSSKVLAPTDPLYAEWQLLIRLKSAFPGSGTYTRLEFVPEVR